MIQARYRNGIYFQGVSQNHSLEESSLPRHFRGTKDPFENCAMTALRNLFSFYGKPQYGEIIEYPLLKMLKNVQLFGVRGINRDVTQTILNQLEPGVRQSVDRAFATNDLSNGFLTKVSKNGTEAIVLGGASIPLFLAECGAEPQFIRFGNPESLFKAKQILREGKPLLISERNAIPMWLRIHHKDLKIGGHLYMVFRDPGGVVYLSDSNGAKAIPVPDAELDKTLQSSENSGFYLKKPPVVPSYLLQGMPIRRPNELGPINFQHVTPVV